MSFENQTISVHFAHAVITAAKRRGFEVEPLLQSASLNTEMLDSPDMRITSEQLARLMQAAWMMEDDEFLGMSNAGSRHGVFTLMAKQAVNCKTLRGVYRHLTRFYNLTSDALQLGLKIDQEHAQISMRLTAPEQDCEHMLSDFLMLLWHRFPSWLIGRVIPLDLIEFDFPEPAHAREYRLLFPCEARFDAPVTRFTFPAEYLSFPVVQTDSTLRAHLRTAPLDWFKKQNYYPTYTRLVLDALSDGDTFNNLQIEEIAESLAITSRTLRRKLAEEDTSFNEIKNIARRDTALHLLCQQRHSIASVAHRLGYSEAASFTRAFKEWTGVTPFAYRNPFRSKDKSWKRRRTTAFD